MPCKNSCKSFLSFFPSIFSLFCHFLPLKSKKKIAFFLNYWLNLFNYQLNYHMFINYRLYCSGIQEPHGLTTLAV